LEKTEGIVAPTGFAVSSNKIKGCQAPRGVSPVWPIHCYNRNTGL